MKIEVSISGKMRVVELARESDSGGWRILLDGQLVDADVAEIAPNIFSVLIGGESHEVKVTPSSSNGALTLQTAHHEFSAEVRDPRAWRGRRGTIEAEGRQQVVAPMPGKVVRVLVQAGDQVEAGQGLLVVEAMKMQNEVRSPKSGTVERLLAKEGQPVNAGEVLCVVS
jgi:biotin carboxyl carrier protein